MVKQWKNFDSPSQSVVSAQLGAMAEAGDFTTAIREMSMAEAFEQPASRFVKTVQRWCPKRVPESYGRGINFNKVQLKPSFLFVKNAVSQNAETGVPFGLKEVLVWMDIVNKSNGVLQNQMLSPSVCCGILKKSVREIPGRKKKEMKNMFVLNDKPFEKCPHLQSSGKCDFNWDTGAITEYFE